jgi:hypothetical protein
MARAQPIAVVAELFEHPETVYRSFRSMVKDMQLDEVEGQSFSIHDNGRR